MLAFVAYVSYDVSFFTNAYTFVSPLSSSKISSLQETPSINFAVGTRRNKSELFMSDGDKKEFSLATLFGKNSSSNASTKQSSKLPPHPSERPHISPLNILDPSKLNQSDPATNPMLRGGTSPAESLFGPDGSLPLHPSVKSGVLKNGLSYVILPNKSPPDRFEAHLQVFSGSADELEHQQGIAHLTEHVAYMGSRKRERLFGTGSQTNAYTDFHHTVFYAACPIKTPRGNLPMLPMALDALCDVMEARVESSRLEKERQAVLSEMTMVNTIEYRVECQILSTLHRENRLAKRFPIGKETLIRNWKTDDVKTWHRTHYRPDNVLLYIVGDVSPQEAERVINEKFGHLSAEKQATAMEEKVKPEAAQLADAVVNSETVKAKMSWHYPPIIHNWVGDNNHLEEAQDKALAGTEYDIQLQDKWPLDEVVDFLKTTELAPGKKLRPHIFRHELLQSFSLHLFAKRPVDQINDLSSFRRSLARRVALAALQIRLNVGGRSEDPPFTFVEFNQLDSAREGCAICSLDMTAEPHRWKEAVCKSVSEIRKLGLYGVTQGEMERYAGALMTDAAQLAAQGNRISHGDQLAFLMETIANGHNFMSPEQSYFVTEEALRSLTVEEVNEAARSLCSHVLGFQKDEKGDDGVVVAVACSPKSASEDASSESFCDEEALIKTIYDACQTEVEPEEDVVVPDTLVPDEEIAAALAKHPAEWMEGQFTDGTPNTPADKMTRPFTLRRLSNGIRVGIARNDAESQRGHLRLVAPGGRDAEKKLGFKSGSMAVGARAMQEGGAFGPWTREQVELFCVDHLLMVEISCSEENILIDFVFPTTNVGNTGFGEEVKLGITGTEAVLQIVREIIVGFHWEEDALGRSKSSFRTAHDGLQKNLEGKSTEVIMEEMTGKDDRYLSIDVDTVNAVTLEEARAAVMSQLLPPELELSIVGDFDPSEVLEMVRKYIGSVPADANSEYTKEDQVPVNFDSVPTIPEKGKFIEIELTDSDPRAVAYVAGSAPNLWGFLGDGSTVADYVLSRDKKASEYDKSRRSHPLFSYITLALVSEIINRRLFSYVRERKQLTYDANFSLTGFERLKGGWFLVTVTASKENAQAALEACKETLQALFRGNPVSPDNLESAKRVVLNRHQVELRTTRYWAEMMSGLQSESVPLKGPLTVTDFDKMVEAITTTDLQLALDCFGMKDDQLFTAIGKTVQPEGYVPPDDGLVSQAPVIGMRRGGALKD